VLIRQSNTVDLPLPVVVFVCVVVVLLVLRLMDKAAVPQKPRLVKPREPFRHPGGPLQGQLIQRDLDVGTTLPPSAGGTQHRTKRTPPFTITRHGGNRSTTKV
jgi:hypothetical protein